MKKDDPSELVRAAEAIERDLVQLENLSRSLGNIRLHTEKSIARAGRTLQQGLEQQEQLVHALRALAEAMAGMQQRQQAAVDRLAQRALEIRAQVTRVSEHVERFAALGVKASEATRMLEALPRPHGSAEPAPDASPGPPQELLRVDVLLAGLVSEAKALAASAESTDLVEVAREAATLCQRIDAARAKLALLSQARPAS